MIKLFHLLYFRRPISNTDDTARKLSLSNLGLEISCEPLPELEVIVTSAHVTIATSPALPAEFTFCSRPRSTNKITENTM